MSASQIHDETNWEINFIEYKYMRTQRNKILIILILKTVQLYTARLAQSASLHSDVYVEFKTVSRRAWLAYKWTSK